MSTLHLTLASHGLEWLEFFDKALDSFSRERHFSTKTTTYEWDVIWKQLVDISIHKSGADVSVVGSTWVASLVSMNSLRPFQPTDIARLGGKGAFSPASWQSATVMGSEQVWAIPYMADVRVVYYWRDLLEQAGIDETNAFSTPEAFQETLERLQPTIPTPLVLQTNNQTRDPLYIAASWLWAEGGDFVSADGKSTLLNEPLARQSLQKHFELVRFLPGNQLISNDRAREIFFQRQAAVTIAGSWFAWDLSRPENIPAWGAQLGIASMPGPSFVGGVNLVIWNHSLLERETMQLIEWLVSPKFQKSLISYTNNLPVTQAAMQTLAQNNPHTKQFVHSIQTGRALPAIPLWGLTEQRLSEAICRIWQELSESREANVAEVLSRRIPILAHRINNILAG
jgi:multiple sugar transport system substrate-binding protein